jgi:predicted transcriptional regulator
MVCMSKKVRDIMRHDVYTIKEDQKISDLLNFFVEKDISGAPVTGKDNTLTGIITPIDVFEQIHEYPSYIDAMTYMVAIDCEGLADSNIESLLERQIKELMTKHVVTVEADLSILKAAKIFSKKKFKKIPVVENDKLVGILTHRDMINYLVSSFLNKPD